MTKRIKRMRLRVATKDGPDLRNSIFSRQVVPAPQLTWRDQTLERYANSCCTLYGNFQACCRLSPGQWHGCGYRAPSADHLAPSGCPREEAALKACELPTGSDPQNSGLDASNLGLQVLDDLLALLSFAGRACLPVTWLLKAPGGIPPIL